MFDVRGSTAIELTPRPPNTVLPYGPVQVSPPSVDLYSPCPCTQPLAHVLPSPVPTNSVLPLASFGSSAIDPIELISNEPLRYFHDGSSASAFSVRQSSRAKTPLSY